MVAKNYASGGLNGAEDRVGVAWKGARSSVVTVFWKRHRTWMRAAGWDGWGRRLLWAS